jgi:hypothetical protein
VVAGAGRDHAVGALGVGHPGDPDVRAADLVRPGALEIFAFEPGRPAEGGAQRPARFEGGGADDAGEQIPRGFDVGETDKLRHDPIVAPPGAAGAPGSREMTGAAGAGCTCGAAGTGGGGYGCVAGMACAGTVMPGRT